MTCSPTRLPIWLSQAPGVIRPDDMAPKIDATQAVVCFSEPFYRCLIDGLGLSGSQPYGKVLGASVNLAGSVAGAANGEWNDAFIPHQHGFPDEEVGLGSLAGDTLPNPHLG